MANTISLAEKFQPIVDEVYQNSSLTAVMDSPTKPVDFGGAAEVKIYKTGVSGLGNYSRNNGYVEGDVSGAWETLTLLASRGRKFSIDRMDDEESLGLAFGTLAGEFLRTKVIPEIDAYRFAKYASAPGISQKSATLTSSNVLDELDSAQSALDDDEVPTEGRLCFVSSDSYKLVKAAVARYLGNENGVNRNVTSFDDMKIIRVPKKRFYTAVTLLDGKTAGQEKGGFVPTEDVAKAINFMIIHPTAVLQAIKHAKLKVFEPDINQDKDAYSIQYRLYHDAFAYENKVAGIYLNKKS